MKETNNMAKKQEGKHRKVFFCVQGKGGVGKTTIAVRLSEALIRKYGKEEVALLDTDPVNDTFHQHLGLDVAFLDLIGDNEFKIDSLKFDELIELIVNNSAEATFVDTGASNFLALLHYAYEIDMFELLEDAGLEVYFIIPVAGGANFTDCIEGLGAVCGIAQNSKSSKIVAVVNEFFGKAADEHGRNLKNLVLLDDALSTLPINIVEIPIRSMDTYGKQLEELGKKHLTIGEALAMDGSLPVKKRLQIVSSDYDEMLGLILQ